VSDNVHRLNTDLDTEVVLVTFSEPTHLRQYREINNLAYPILSDPERAAYRAFGLERGSFARVWSVGTIRRYVDLFRANGFGDLRRPTEDTRQLGGDFVIAPDGTLAWGFWGSGPDDRPSIDELLVAVSAAGKN